MPKVKFLKEKLELEFPEGANLRKESLKAKIELYPGIHKYLNCRGLGLCAKCAVEVKSGMQNCSAMGFREKFRLLLSYVSIGREDEIRLACQTQVTGDMEISTTPSLKL